MPNHIFQLNQFDLIRFTGPDSRKFLQGQVSCNMDLLSADQSLRGALCNLKGRVVADFRIFTDNRVASSGDDCLMQVNRGLGERVRSSLAKYAVFSKVDLSLDDNSFLRLGLLGEDAQDIIQGIVGDCPAAADQLVRNDDGLVIRLPGLQPRFEIWQPLVNGATVTKATGFSTLLQLDHGNDEQWRRQDISQGIIHIDPDTSEQYTPQLLNYDISGVIDFKKGCYTGQEVVARMFYRSTAKKRLFRARVEADSVTTENLILHGDDQPQTEAILSCARISQTDFELLAVLPANIGENNQTMTLNNDQHSPLTILTLPYTK